MEDFPPDVFGQESGDEEYSAGVVCHHGLCCLLGWRLGDDVMTHRDVFDSVIVEWVVSDADFAKSRVLVPPQVPVIYGLAEFTDAVLLDLLEQHSKLPCDPFRSVDNSLRYRGAHLHN